MADSTTETRPPDPPPPPAPREIPRTSDTSRQAEGDPLPRDAAEDPSPRGTEWRTADENIRSQYAEAGGHAEAGGELSPAEQQEVADYKQDLLDTEGRNRPADGVGPEWDYQRNHCGDTEFRLSGDEALPRETWADDINVQEGMAQDAKFVDNPEQSWYKPDTLPGGMAEIATKDMDDRLAKYKDAIDDPDNPIRGLEIITNDTGAGRFIESRMDFLGVPGKITIED